MSYRRDYEASPEQLFIQHVQSNFQAMLIEFGILLTLIAVVVSVHLVLFEWTVRSKVKHLDAEVADIRKKINLQTEEFKKAIDDNILGLQRLLYRDIELLEKRIRREAVRKASSLDNGFSFPVHRPDVYDSQLEKQDSPATTDRTTLCVYQIRTSSPSFTV